MGNVTPDIWESLCRVSGAVKLRDVTHPGQLVSAVQPQKRSQFGHPFYYLHVLQLGF